LEAARQTGCHGNPFLESVVVTFVGIDKDKPAKALAAHVDDRSAQSPQGFGLVVLADAEHEAIPARLGPVDTAKHVSVQQTSRANTWLSGKTDTDWLYGYGAWTVPLAA
jgi:hypothetical protein